MIKLRHILIIIIFISSSFFTFTFAENNANSSPFKVFVNMEKMTFENDEPVLLQVIIKNNTFSKKAFKIFDTEYVTFRPVVYDMNGKEADTLVEYRLKNIQITDVIKNISPRIIELLQNETFSYTIDLNRIYSFEFGKNYRVKALFLMDAAVSNSIVSENVITFNVLKFASDIKNSGISRIRQFTSPKRDFSPSEIVLLFLKAEKERNWDNYFKLIDIEKYINAYPDYVRIINEANRKNDIEGKERIILDFVDYLKEARSDYIISYQIERELQKNENYSYVEAMVTRFSAGIPLMYRYRYSLERYENLWVITDVEVTVSKRQKS